MSKPESKTCGAILNDLDGVIIKSLSLTRKLNDDHHNVERSEVFEVAAMLRLACEELKRLKYARPYFDAYDLAIREGFSQADARDHAEQRTGMRIFL